MKKEELIEKIRGCNSFVDFFKFKQDILDCLEPPKTKGKTKKGVSYNG